MVFSYVSLVIKKTLQRAVVWTDSLQIILAVTVPAVYVALGWPMPSGSPDMIAAWIGYSVVSLILLRLVFFAPYALWREARGEIASLEDKIGSQKHRARLEIEKSLIEDRKAALKFLSEYRVTKSDLNVCSERISDFPEFYGPMSRLMADDNSIRPMLDSLEQAHARIILLKRVSAKYSDEVNKCVIEGTIERHAEQYAIHRQSLQDYLLSK